MSLLVVGSIALDTIETPYGRIEEALGGSATYFSLAASLLTDVRLVGVVGEDFPAEHVAMLEGRRINTAGLQVKEGRTFRWTGAYKGDMSEAETLDVELNVFASFDPRIPHEYADTKYVFLANGSPGMQQAVRDQLESAELVVCDTMNYWIESAGDELRSLFRAVDGVMLNDREARMFTGRDLLIDAGRHILDMGPRFVVIKKGEHGAMLVSVDGCASLPAYPTSEVKDPTGAGDAFAGGFMGAVTLSGECSLDGLKRAMAYGTVAASVTVEGLGTSAIGEAAGELLEARLADYRDMLRV